MNEYAIETIDLHRSYGREPVLKGVNLRVKRGSIYGFLGRNGAGKTTLMKILAGLQRSSTGAARVLGRDPFTFSAEDRRSVGYVSEKQNLPSMMRVSRLLDFTASFYPAWDAKLCSDLVERFGIPLRQRVGKLSLGNQRLLGIILAMAPRPDVLLLDEPAANLDVVARREFLDGMLDLIRDGERTVFISTHILSDVERVADEVGVLVDGVLRASCSLDELKESILRVRFFDFEAAMPVDLAGVLNYQRGKNEMIVSLDTRISGGPEALAARWRCRFEVHALSLEDIFVELAKKQS